MTFDIAIIGAGLAGPALALELLNVPGLSCTIYEMRDGIEEGQHISLSPNSLRIMENIGVLKRLQSIGNSYEKLYLRNAQAAVLAKFDNGNASTYGYTAMRIHRRHVQRVLIEQCQAKGIKILLNKKLKAIEEPAGTSKVRLTFEDGQIVLTDLLVGADGLHSRIRSYVNPGSKENWAAMLGVTGYLDKAKLHPSVSRIELPAHFIGHNGFIAIMPSNQAGDEIGFFSTMDFPEDKSREEWAKLYRDKDAVRAILHSRFSKKEGWCELVDSMCLTANDESLCSWPFHIAPPLPKWASESSRVLILGDAAHAMIPTGGLGASLAFEDVECLAKCLKHIAPKGFNISAFKRTLKPWEEHRRERLALIQQFTNRNRRLRQAGGRWLAQLVKEWFVWGLFKVIGTGGAAEPIYSYNTEKFETMLPVV